MSKIFTYANFETLKKKDKYDLNVKVPKTLCYYHHSLKNLFKIFIFMLYLTQIDCLVENEISFFTVRPIKLWNRKTTVGLKL